MDHSFCPSFNFRAVIMKRGPSYGIEYVNACIEMNLALFSLEEGRRY